MGEKSSTYVLLGKTSGLSDALKSAGKDTDALAAQQKHLSAAFKDLGESAAGVYVLTKVKDFFTGSVTAASDLNEVLSKTQQVFGAATPSIVQFGQSAATALGMSETTALDATDRFGNLFKNIGLTTDNAAKMSTQLVRTASDLASFHNVDPSEMLDAVSSALAGEYDPLQRYGFAISAAAVQQQALKLGLVQTKAEITPAISAQAAYSLILQQTGAAAGDFARTSGGLANQQRILGAEVENLKASLGNALLPTINAVVGGINTLLGAFQTLPTWLQQTVVGVGAVSVGVLAGGMAFLKAKDAVTELGTALGGFKSKGITDAAAGMEGAATSSGKLRTALGGVGSFLAGPWGIALAGGVAILGIWAAKHAEAAARVDDLTSALQKDNGAIGENTRAKTVNQLETDGVLKSAQQLGLNLSDVTDAALGNAAAMDRVNASISAQQSTLSSAHQSMAGMRGATIDTRTEQDRYAQAAKNVTDAIGNQNGVLTDAKGQFQRTTQAMGGAKDGAVQFTSGLSAQEQKTKDATSALKALRDELDTSKNALMGVFSETTAYYGAVDRATASVKTNGATLSEHTAKGRENRDALANLVDETGKYLQAELDATGGGAQFTAKLGETRAALVTAAQQMGMSKTAANQFADSILAIPTAHATKITADTSGALAAIRSVEQALSAVPRSVTTIVSTIVQSVSKAEGGWVPGAPSSVDTVPAMLAGGEFVVKSDQAQQWGPILEAINSGSVTGGGSGAVVGSVNGGAGAGGSTYYVVNINSAIVGSEQAIAAAVDDSLRRISARAGRSA